MDPKNVQKSGSIFKAQTAASQQLVDNLKQEIKKIRCSFWRGIDCFPTAVKFENQEPEEKIILFLRQHVIVNIKWIIVAILLAILPLILQYIELFELMPIRFRIMTLVLWYLFVLVFIIEKTLSWIYNSYIITDERVIDIDFYSLVYKHISETKIDKIEDVTYEQGGFFQSFFDYGLITIQTAAEKREFEFECIPQPARVAKVLNQLILQEEQEAYEGRAQ